MSRTTQFIVVALFSILLLCADDDKSGGSFAHAPPRPTPTPRPTAPPFDVPPAGITATTTTLQALLAAHAKAVGSPKTAVTTEIESGSISAYGLDGTYRSVITPNAWRISETLGKMTTQAGAYKGEEWAQDENGLTILLHGVHKRDVVSAVALERSRGNADDTNVRLLGAVASPIAAYVVEVNPPDGRHEYVFYDSKTFLVARREAAYPDRREITTYDDFRTTNGQTTAWHRHYSDGHPQNESDYTTKSDAVNTTVADSDVAIPGITRTLLEYPAGATTANLPARIEDGTIIVRVTINGRGLDFALDSGSDSIVIDHDVAKQLGLETFGKAYVTVAGSFEQSHAIIPEMKIGDLTMHNIIVDSLPFAQNVDQHTKIVGLLGFDFIADNVVSIDYDLGRVSVTQSDAFQPPADASYVDALLDDGVPMVSASINGAVGNHFILDTGADMVVIFDEFARAHPTEVTDLGEGREINRYLRYLSASGVGGDIEMSALQIKDFGFGPVHFQEFIAMQTRSKAFEGEDADGLIGYEFLRDFHLYLDYVHGRVYLQPSEFLKHTGRLLP